MDDLMHVKQVVAHTLADLQQDLDPKRAGIKVALYGMFDLGVIAFDESFSAFTGSVGQDPVTYDRWLSVQMQIWTDLGPNRSQLISDFKAMFNQVIKQTDGGEAFVQHTDAEKFSYVCALMIRVYADQLVLQVEEEPPVEGEKQ